MNKILKFAKWLSSELQNLWIGFVHNPIVTANNWGVDRVNAFLEDLEGATKHSKAQRKAQIEQLRDVVRNLKNRS